jgi:CBS domain-containing membrane protein
LNRVSVPTLLGALRRFAGIGANRTGHLEKWVSGAGGLTGILGVMLVSQAYLGMGGSAGLVASMGASAVLLFAVPHGPLSQPWAVFGGHLVSATIGVSCGMLHTDPIIASALAVALAISAMYYLRCIHPPGGATALTAVAGGDAVHALGFHYVLTPVLLNVCVILLVAILFNWPFPWRRYPAVWAQRRNRPAAPEANKQFEKSFTHAELASAAGTLDPSLGISKDMLDTLCSLASDNPESGTLRPADIGIGRCYSNGEFGLQWQVRQVISENGMETAGSRTDPLITYRIVAGHKRRLEGSTRRRQFADWARYEVYLNENSWQRVDTAHHHAVADNAA